MESPPRVTRAEVAILDADQMRGVMRKVEGRDIYPQVIIALCTGMRREEILALRWQHVDFDRKTITVRAAIEETNAGLRFKAPKSEAGMRTITLPDLAVETLQTYRRQQLEQRLALGLGKLTDDSLLFVRPNGAPQSPHALSKQWKAVADDIGLEGITFHSLRHTHAIQLIDAGIDVVKISKRLGHAAPTVTLDVYAHLFGQREDSDQ